METSASRQTVGLVGGVKIDLRRLHGEWMELLFRRQRRGHSVLGKWKPETPAQTIAYYSWYLLGALILLVLYPLAVVGFAVRFYTTRIDSTATRLGVVGVTALCVLVWGSLTVLARLELDGAGFVAVAAASSVATISAGLAVLCGRYGGRGVTIVLAYPLAMTAVFLPPVVAALSYEPLEAIIFPPSETLAIMILDGVLHVGGLNDLIRGTFDLEGINYVFMWVAIAAPVGWTLGLLVELANLVRPRR